MAIFKPTGTASDSADYLGIKRCSVKNWTESSSKWEWADLFLGAELDIEGTDYEQSLEIKGGYERDAAGTINGGAVLKRLYHLFELLNCTAGVTTSGAFEDEDGGAITDIADYMNQRYTTYDVNKPDQYSHLIYIYKKASTKPGVNKAYTTVHTRMYPNTDKGRADITSHVAWMKSKGYLKEWTGTSTTDAALLVDNL